MRYLSDQKYTSWLDEHVSSKNSGTDEQDVDVSSDAGAVFQHLLHSTQQHAENSLLDVLVAVDAGSQ